MKIKSGKLLLSLALAFGLFACQNKADQEDNSKVLAKWDMVWEQRFDNEQIDQSVWSRIERGTEARNKYMSDSPDMVAFKDGAIVLRGLKNTFNPNDEVPYLTSGITTKGKKSFGLGRLEIRAKHANAAGTWASLWLLPDTTTAMKGGEIDVMERYGIDEFVYQSVRSTYTHEAGMADNPPSSALVGINPNEYHTYAVETYPDSVVFWIDDLRTKTYPRILTDMEGQFPYADNTYHLLMGVQIDSSGIPDSVNTASNLFVEYVRFYQPKQAQPK